MAYRSFREFLSSLEKEREMKSPGGGKALLFERPIIDGQTSEFPVAINTMGSRRRMALALQVSDIADIAQEIQLILKAKPPTDLREGWSLLKQGIHLLHARPKHVREAACQEVVHEIEKRSKTNTQRSTISPCAIYRSSNVGRKTAGVSLLWQTCTRAIRRQARETWAFIGCKFMMSARPECTGNFTRSERATVNAITSAVSGCQWQLRSAVIPFTRSPPPRRCRTVWMNCSSLGFCEKNQSSSSAAKRSISMCRQTSTLFWKDMCSRVRCVQRVPLAITPAFIQRLKIIRFSM